MFRTRMVLHSFSQNSFMGSTSLFLQQTHIISEHLRTNQRHLKTTSAFLSQTTGPLKRHQTLNKTTKKTPKKGHFHRWKLWGDVTDPCHSAYLGNVAAVTDYCSKSEDRCTDCGGAARWAMRGGGVWVGEWKGRDLVGFKRKIGGNWRSWLLVGIGMLILLGLNLWLGFCMFFVLCFLVKVRGSSKKGVVFSGTSFETLIARNGKKST